jgi:Fic family protein
MVIPYMRPNDWVRYDIARILQPLSDAKAAVLSLTSVPFQKSWAEKLQAVQLKQEVAGTSRIEGADFTEHELDEALDAGVGSESMTRSQRQARAAVNTYRWIAKLPGDRPITCDLILETHRRIITGCDDDHCPPGQIRQADQNVTFGTPRHRGAEGGRPCAEAFNALCDALSRQFTEHDILIQALALHYQFGAMHPFLDGNGRTARALEALMLQRAGLRDALFIALSNYYYDEKANYLRSLSAVKEQGGDLTPFLIFGLVGITQQCRRLLAEINKNILKAMFRDLANDLFHRLSSTKKRVIAKRQLSIISHLLERDKVIVPELYKAIKPEYQLKEPWTAFVRDVVALRNLGAVELIFDTKDNPAPADKVWASIRLQWPTEITETAFFQKVRQMPRSKNFNQLGV